MGCSFADGDFSFGGSLGDGAGFPVGGDFGGECEGVIVERGVEGADERETDGVGLLLEHFDFRGLALFHVLVPGGGVGNPELAALGLELVEEGHEPIERGDEPVGADAVEIEVAHFALGDGGIDDGEGFGGGFVVDGRALEGRAIGEVVFIERGLDFFLGHFPWDAAGLPVGEEARRFAVGVELVEDLVVFREFLVELGGVVHTFVGEGVIGRDDVGAFHGFLPLGLEAGVEAVASDEVEGAGDFALLELGDDVFELAGGAVVEREEEAGFFAFVPFEDFGASGGLGGGACDGGEGQGEEEGGEGATGVDGGRLHGVGRESCDMGPKWQGAWGAFWEAELGWR